jgi:hypothetical protein
VAPLSNEKYTPLVPTPLVNGQVVGSPALHASSSILSFEPATRIFGWLASTAIAGSFCLFCENGVVGLPLVTSGSLLATKAIAAAAERSVHALAMRKYERI